MITTSYRSRKMHYADYLCYQIESSRVRSRRATFREFQFCVTCDTDLFLVVPPEDYRRLVELRVGNKELPRDYYYCEFVLTERSVKLHGLIVPSRELQRSNLIILRFKEGVVDFREEIQVLSLSPDTIEYYNIQEGESRRDSSIYQRPYAEPGDIWENKPL